MSFCAFKNLRLQKRPVGCISIRFWHCNTNNIEMKNCSKLYRKLFTLENIVLSKFVPSYCNCNIGNRWWQRMFLSYDCEWSLTQQWSLLLTKLLWQALTIPIKLNINSYLKVPRGNIYVLSNFSPDFRIKCECDTSIWLWRRMNLSHRLWMITKKEWSRLNFIVTSIALNILQINEIKQKLILSLVDDSR